ncbi:hypothetical protein [Streptomyces sp. NPDC058092]|uniref:hypothetical protein n=1 Tax=Streptomyces sp. NPDC058092 TaxID=3346336 RepID=UPI0036EC6523
MNIDLAAIEVPPSLVDKRLLFSVIDRASRPYIEHVRAVAAGLDSLRDDVR